MTIGRSGTILIRDLEVQAQIGIDEQERDISQRLLVNSEVTLDIGKAIESKDVSATIRYDILAEQFRSRIQSKKWILVEELLEDLSAFVLETYPMAQEVRIRAQKFTVEDTAWVGVQIARTRNQDG